MVENLEEFMAEVESHRDYYTEALENLDDVIDVYDRINMLLQSKMPELVKLGNQILSDFQESLSDDLDSIKDGDFNVEDIKRKMGD